MDYLAKYDRVHVPSGRTYPDTQEFMSRAEFLRAMAKWNKMSPSMWAYTETGGHHINVRRYKGQADMFGVEG